MGSNLDKSGNHDAAIAAFLEKVKQTPAPVLAGNRGRLIFALDATMSRQPTWDRACKLQAEMFAETKAIGGLDVQLVFFRGHNEFSAGKWVNDADALSRQMTGIQCRGGFTQIGRVLEHAAAEAGQARTLVFVGDACEEDVDALCASAGKLALQGMKTFLFHEGQNRRARSAFQEIARITGGAYCPFDASSPQQLRDLLRAVAAYAAGGKRALAALTSRTGRDVQLLIEQLR
ncbi:MAG TPA: hypothetical protein PL096_06500 [Micropepsaceae bacterium]|nr:hypothetical protein [Micropepsaceae bacterium]